METAELLTELLTSVVNAETLLIHNPDKFDEYVET
jgi:hypothetical protein